MGASLSALDPELRGAAVEFVQWLGAQGLQPRITSTLRTRAEQTRLYNRFLQGISQFPAAPPGQSPHEYGWAFDLIVTPYEYQEAVGQAWTEIGGSWGGRGDPVHFELSGASAAAASFLEAPGREKSWPERYADFYDNLPWWIQLVLPVASLVQREPTKYSENAIARILRKAGY